MIENKLKNRLRKRLAFRTTQDMPQESMPCVALCAWIRQVQTACQRLIR